MTDAGDMKILHVADNNSALFKFKQEKTNKTAANGRKDVKIAEPLKYITKIWTTLEMPSINCEINLILTWSDKCVLSFSNDTKAATFAISNTKCYVPVVTLSTQDNAKLLQQLKSAFRRTTDWNKY